MPDPLPMLWLCGPPGVGKSTVAWELFQAMPGAAHVDIDQLGMCFPETPADPGRTVLEARVLGRVVANFRAAGAGCLIVSGYLDVRRGIHTEYLTEAALTVLRLRCDLPQLRRRLAVRARPGEDRESALHEAEVLDRGALPYPCLDTTGRGVAELLSTVRDRWPGDLVRQPGGWPAPVPTPGEILWVCGPIAAGKSTAGYEVAVRSRRAGHMTGFVDLQQIGFRHPAAGHPADHRLRAANLAAVWAEFSAHGARRLVVVGPVDEPGQLQRYADALPAADLTLYRLHASPGQLRRRIRQRGAGGGPPIAGDRLRGQPAAVLARAHDAAVAQAAALEGAGIDAVRVDTDDRSAGDVAREIVDRAGW